MGGMRLIPFLWRRPILSSVLAKLIDQNAHRINNPAAGNVGTDNGGCLFPDNLEIIRIVDHRTLLVILTLGDRQAPPVIAEKTQMQLSLR